MEAKVVCVMRTDLEASDTLEPVISILWEVFDIWEWNHNGS